MFSAHVRGCHSAIAGCAAQCRCSAAEVIVFLSSCKHYVISRVLSSLVICRQVPLCHAQICTAKAFVDPASGLRSTWAASRLQEWCKERMSTSKFAFLTPNIFKLSSDLKFAVSFSQVMQRRWAGPASKGTTCLTQ